MTTHLYSQRPQHRPDGATRVDSIKAESALPPTADDYLKGKSAAALPKKPAGGMQGACPPGTVEQAVLPASTGNEDPGSEIELLGIGRAHIGRQREQST